jgi:hypothetical protein
MSIQIKQSLLDAAHGRKSPVRAAAGIERTKLDGIPRCPDCGITRYPRNHYKQDCYCGYCWQSLSIPPTA